MSLLNVIVAPFAFIGFLVVILGIRESMRRARYGKDHAKVLRTGFNRKHHKRRKAA